MDERPGETLKRPSRWDQSRSCTGKECDLNQVESQAKEAARAALMAKRRRVSASSESLDLSSIKSIPPIPTRSMHPIIQGCHSISEYEKLNRIEEGSYGIVSRARHKATGTIVALKQLKLEKEKYGFPITSLREIHTLMEARHPHIVELKEMVVGQTLNQIYLVMEFVEHDMKTLLSRMRTPFLPSEIKTLLQQILSAVALMHSRWIVHRDLKTSNLLMSNHGRIKIADFGLARMFGDPLETMTSLVVTLWYRAPELLLGAKLYDTAVDMWSVGCIFAELLHKEPLFPGKNEADQLARIYRLLGQPTKETWPAYDTLPNANARIRAPSRSSLKHHFRYCSDATIDLLQRMLTYDPTKRITAEEALHHPYFQESPAPAHPDSFGSFPSIATGGSKTKYVSPEVPQRRLSNSAAYPLQFDM